MVKTKVSIPIKFVGVASDHGWFELKVKLIATLKDSVYSMVDFGAYRLDNVDDYPDFVAPLARAVARGDIARGLAICGSGVGACIVTNKVAGIRAALITDPYSARQGVEVDNMNIICLGENVTGYSLALELVKIFLNASFKETERYVRRLRKVSTLESENQLN